MTPPTITGKTVKIGTKSFSAMFAELRELHAGDGPAEVPAGAFSAEQYAAANDVSYDSAYQYCHRLCSAKKLSKIKVKVRSNGDFRLRTYFVKVG
tara:strand:- start:143 stop:427 length:285 start_codon:yes stop_codon:yes gene_type:complete